MLFTLPPGAGFRCTVVASLTVAATACDMGRDRPEVTRTIPAAQEAFWSRLTTLCGSAYGGRAVESQPPDSAMSQSVLVMHVRECTGDTIRIPFHVGSNRSRTWVVTRTATGLSLKHDHRHEDGTADSVTQYGGDTRDAGDSTRQEFHADSATAALIPAARANVWTLELVPGQRFAYALRREGSDRRFRAEFDLASSVPVPPAPWGSVPR